MRGFRLSAFARGPAEPTEIATNAMALGWAIAFFDPDLFGPPGTAVHNVSVAMNPTVAGMWMLFTAALPIVSILINKWWVRVASTVACSLGWSTLIVISMRGGVLFSPSIEIAMICIASLSWSQWQLITERWPHVE